MNWSWRHLVIWSLFGILNLGFGTSPTLAVVDPLAVPNNRVGVHILDPGEVEQAAKLVNSSGGQWGYVTVVLRSNELDREKWINFFEASRRLKVIPIVRLATYPDGEVWVKPDALDLVDFANFLADMPWPVKNRYIVLFNEVNHASEWGGDVNPLEYSTLLLDAKTIFKQRSGDFFLLSAGLDMSAPQSKTSWDALNFYRQISRLQPNWFEATDGLAVHAYPNPAFSSPPTSQTRYGISSFKYEQKMLKSLGFTSKALFITETGWPHDQPFWQTAFSQVWIDPNIVAITPFVLYAGSGDFARFSLLEANLSPKNGYQEIFNLPKMAGSPLLAETGMSPPGSLFSHPGGGSARPAAEWWQKVTFLWARILGLERVTVGNKELMVEIADTDAARSRGLSNRTSLGTNRGMLFVFDRPAQHSFWMVNMRFPLDFIWIRGGKVVEVIANVPPPDQTGGQPRVIIPTVKADQALEVGSGMIDKYDIKVGDILKRR